MFGVPLYVECFDRNSFIALVVYHNPAVALEQWPYIKELTVKFKGISLKLHYEFWLLDSFSFTHVLYPTFDSPHLFPIYPSWFLFICVQGTFLPQWLTSNTAAAGASTENVIYSLKIQPLLDRWIWVSILPLFYICPNDSVVSKLAHFALPLLSLTQTITSL